MAEAGEYARLSPEGFARGWARRMEQSGDDGRHHSGLGDAAAYLWVARGNERAIRFYRRHDFAEDGTESTDQHDGITEIRMVRG